MADNIWNNSQANNDGNDPANWSLGHVPTGSETALLDATSTDNCTLSGHLSCGALTIADAYGAGNFDAVTFDITTTGDMTFDNGSGTVRMGVGSTWTCGGSFDNADAGTWDGETSTLTMTGTATIRIYYNKRPKHFTIAENAVITVASNEAQPTGTITIDGELAVPNGQTFGVQSGGNLVVNATGSITGDGKIYLYSGANMPTLHVDGTLSPGTLYIYQPTTARTYAPGAGWDCNVSISNKNVAAAYAIRLNGDYLVTGDLTVGTNTAGATLVVDNLTYGPSFVVQGNVTILEEDAASVTWTKGAGTITLDGSGNQSIDFDDQAIEALVIANTGGVVTFDGGWTALSFDAQTGDFDPNGQTLETTGNFSIAAGVNLISAGQGNLLWDGVALTVGGTFSACGSSGDLLNLRGTATWTLIVANTATADYADVSYSDATGGVAVTATRSTDNGDNFGWTFDVGGPFRVAVGEVFLATASVGQISS